MTGEPYQNVVYEKEQDSDARTWGMVCHLGALAVYLVPFGNMIGPLIAWQIKKDSSAFVDFHGKESLNFQITVTIAFFVSLLLCLALIGFLLLPALAIYELVFVIIAAVKASGGEYYQYPFTIRFIK